MPQHSETQCWVRVLQMEVQLHSGADCWAVFPGCRGAHLAKYVLGTGSQNPGDLCDETFLNESSAFYQNHILSVTWCGLCKGPYPRMTPYNWAGQARTNLPAAYDCHRAQPAARVNAMLSSTLKIASLSCRVWS